MTIVDYGPHKFEPKTGIYSKACAICSRVAEAPIHRSRKKYRPKLLTKTQWRRIFNRRVSIYG